MSKLHFRTVLDTNLAYAPVLDGSLKRAVASPLSHSENARQDIASTNCFSPCDSGTKTENPSILLVCKHAFSLLTSTNRQHHNVICLQTAEFFWHDFISRDEKGWRKPRKKWNCEETRACLGLPLLNIVCAQRLSRKRALVRGSNTFFGSKHDVINVIS